MEKLSPADQVKVKKINTDRLRAKLLQAEMDEDKVMSVSRDQLLASDAEHLMSGNAEASGVAVKSSMSMEELALRREELDMRKAEIEERRIAREAEDQRFRAVAEERRALREAEEKRHEETDKLCKQELAWQREQLNLQRDKDKREQERQSNIASQVKWYGSALKNSLAKFPHDSAEIPARAHTLTMLNDCSRVMKYLTQFV